MKTVKMPEEPTTADPDGNVIPYPVGYRRPPVHTRFKPGQSGNPSGRTKGSQNLKTIIQRVLREPVALREGNKVRKVSKAEAILRHMVVGALKGDSRNASAVFRLAEQVGEFEETHSVSRPQRLVISWMDCDEEDALPGNSELSRDSEAPASGNGA